MRTRKLIPMLFSSEMARANMEGRKTETRRIVKPQPGVGEYTQRITVTADHLWEAEATDQEWRCPYGKPGDILWMREKHTWLTLEFPAIGEKQEFYAYPSLMEKLKLSHVKVKWKPAIHMPLEACRFFAEITEILVERLHDITEEAAKAEGVLFYDDCNENAGFKNTFKNYIDETLACINPIGSYMSLWSSINGVESTKQNPWVWVVKYRRIDAVEMLQMAPSILASRKKIGDENRIWEIIVANYITMGNKLYPVPNYEEVMKSGIALEVKA